MIDCIPSIWIENNKDRLISIAKNTMYVDDRYSEYLDKKQPVGYVIEFYQEQEFKYLKIGQTANLKARLGQFFGSGNSWRNEVTSGIVRAVIPCDSSVESLTVEAELRQFYFNNPKSRYVPKDRFTDVFFQDTDIENALRRNYDATVYEAKIKKAITPQERSFASTIKTYHNRVAKLKKERDYWIRETAKMQLEKTKQETKTPAEALSDALNAYNQWLMSSLVK